MRSIFGLVSLVLSSLSIAAVNGEPLLYHRYSEGLVPVFLNHDATCSIYSDKVIVERTYAGVATTQVLPLTISAQSLKALRDKMLKASNGKIETEVLPTDIPYDGYYANAIEHAPSIILRVVQSSQGTENKSEEATSLRLFIDAHCPNIR